MDKMENGTSRMHSGGNDCCENWDLFVLHPLRLSFLDAVSQATQAEGVIFMMSPSLFISSSETQHSIILPASGLLNKQKRWQCYLRSIS